MPSRPLPEEYLQLLKQTYDRRCPECGEEPREPAICSVCDACVCVDCKCCPPEGRIGECTAHVLECGGGQGILILTNLSLLVAIDGPCCCFLECPYLDRHGESHARRGKPLWLSHARVSELRRMICCSEVGREISLTNERTSRYITRPL